MPAPPTLRATLIAGAIALASGHAAPASAFSPYLVVPEAEVVDRSPAYRYANMTDAEAYDELDQRAILYSRVASAPGVRAPIRLTGRLHGVWFRSALPPEERVDSPFEILDARLALALDDFAAILEAHDVDEVMHYTMYRPNVGGGSEHGVGDDRGVASAGGVGARRRPVLASRGGSMPKPAPRPEARPAPKAEVQPAPRPEAQPAARPAWRDGAADARSGAAPAKTPPSLGKGALDKHESRGHAPGGAKQKTPAEVDKRAQAAPAPRAAAPTTKPVTAAAPTGKPAASPAPAGKPAMAAAPTRPPPARAPTAIAPAARTSRAAPGTRHPAGLAIDVGQVHLKSENRWVNVAAHFHGRIGERTCGERARVPDEADARTLRALVCEATDQGVFTYVLTPNYNAAHADHFHMEIKPDVRWFLTH